jgi:A118 family predicted phage portal protein
MDKSKMQDIMNMVSKNNRSPVIGTDYDMISIWKSWYRGNVNDFHRYNRKTINGLDINLERLTFNLPKKVAEEWVSIIWNENVHFNLGDEKANEEFYDVLEDNAFKVEFGQLYEKIMGYSGCGALVEYLIDGKTVIDYISGEYILITAGSGTQAKGIVTINVIEKSSTYITHLTYHNLIDGQYVIEHQAYVSTKTTELGSQSRQALTTIFDEATLNEMETNFYEDGKLIGTKFLVKTETDIPFFQVIKPNIVNNYDVDSKMGIPVTANSIDHFKALDVAFDALKNEAENNRTTVVFSEKATREKNRTNNEGETSYIQYVDKRETRYISVPMNDNEDWVKFFKGEFDSESYIAAINRSLSWGCYNCGLGVGYWSYDGTQTYVNEKQVISTNNDLWKNKSKHEIVLYKAFRDMINAIVYLEQSQGRMQSVNLEELDATIKFDDSLIQDDETRKQQSKDLVADGYKPKWRHLVDWEGYTEEEAKQLIAEAKEEDEQANLSFMESVENEPNEDGEEDEES